MPIYKQMCSICYREQVTLYKVHYLKCINDKHFVGAIELFCKSHLPNKYLSIEAINQSLEKENTMQYTHTTKSGVKLEGTVEQINKILSALGEQSLKLHYSTTKSEYIPIKEMADNHLKNAVIRQGIEYLESLRKVDNLDDFQIKQPFYYDDPDLPQELRDLLTELYERI